MLSEMHFKWLTETRALDAEVVAEAGLYSVRGRPGEHVENDENGEVIAFPFIRDGVEIGCKYRGAGKRFWKRKGSEARFFNAAVLERQDLADRSLPLVITEGEIDALSAWTAGFFAVSVPDGAPPARDSYGRLVVVPETALDVDAASDSGFRYLLTDWSALAKVKRIILAVDADEPGQRLLAELARRLGRVRCSFVVFPEGCKDLNDVLVRHGREAVVQVLDSAKPLPISGLYALDDLPPDVPLRTVSTGWGRLDEFLHPYPGALMVVTGLANAGKSAWTAQLAGHLIAMQNWSVAIASFEMRPRIVAAAVERGVVARGVNRQTAPSLLQKHLSFIAPAPDAEDITDVDWLLDKATSAVVRLGITCLIIDPWNEIEHHRKRDETLSEYTGRALRQIKRWANTYEVLVIIVAHPALRAINKAPENFTLYDISDSAHWANKADLGVTIARQGDPKFDTLTGIFVTKVRYQPEAGRLGSMEVDFDPVTRTFTQ